MLSAFAASAGKYGIFAGTYAHAVRLHLERPLHVTVVGDPKDPRTAALTKVAQATAHDVPHLEALAEAKTIALRALALDDKSADAQVALGQVMLFSEWDWTAAERSFQRALAINPNHAEAYLHY